MNKRIISWVSVLALFFITMCNIGVSSAANGGLLDGKSSILHPGSWTINLGNDTKMTDNDPVTYYTMQAESASSTNVTDIDNAYVDLGAEYTITDYFQTSESTLIYTFSDSNKNIVGQFTSISTPSKKSITEIKNVRYVNWGNRSTASKKVYEVDVFGYPEIKSVLAAAGDISKIDLTWNETAGTSEYIIKRSTTPGGPYTTIGTSPTNFFVDSSVLDDTIYYYIVTAIINGLESNASNEASATLVTPQNPDRALLTIYILGGQIKEYDLSAAELNAYLNWYDAKDAGSGPAKYAFTKTWNKGPFKTRTEYIIFDKILTFDVDEYEVENP